MGEQRFLEVVRIADREVVHRVDVSGKSDRHVERVMRGMLINMSDAYFVQDTADLPLPTEPEVAASVEGEG